MNQINITQEKSEVTFEIKTKSKRKYIYLIISFVLALSAIVFCFWKSNQKEKVMEFLTLESQDFNALVICINELSTENQIIDSTDNDDLFFREINDENVKVQNAINKINSLMSHEHQNPPSSIKNSHAMLWQFYSSTKPLLEEYQRYIQYNKDGSAAIVKLEGQIREMGLGLGYNSSMKDIIKYFENSDSTLLEAISAIESLSPPPALEQQKQQTINDAKAMEKIFRDLIEGFKTKDENKIKEISDEAESLFSNDFGKKSKELEKQYFSELHDKFSNLSKKAISIEDVLLSDGFELKLSIESVAIQNW